MAIEDIINHSHSQRPAISQIGRRRCNGVGYRTRSGTVFFTRNGKKISESKLGGHVKNFKISNKGQLFPTIGANNVCSVHVNLGQMGFVFIEGTSNIGVMHH